MHKYSLIWKLCLVLVVNKLIADPYNVTYWKDEAGSCVYAIAYTDTTELNNQWNSDGWNVAFYDFLSVRSVGGVNACPLAAEVSTTGHFILNLKSGTRSFAYRDYNGLRQWISTYYGSGSAPTPTDFLTCGLQMCSKCCGLGEGYDDNINFLPTTITANTEYIPQEAWANDLGDITIPNSENPNGDYQDYDNSEGQGEIQTINVEFPQEFQNSLDQLNTTMESVETTINEMEILATQESADIQEFKNNLNSFYNSYQSYSASGLSKMDIQISHLVGMRDGLSTLDIDLNTVNNSINSQGGNIVDAVNSGSSSIVDAINSGVVTIADSTGQVKAQIQSFQTANNLNIQQLKADLNAGLSGVELAVNDLIIGNQTYQFLGDNLAVKLNEIESSLNSIETKTETANNQRNQINSNLETISDKQDIEIDKEQETKEAVDNVAVAIAENATDLSTVEGLLSDIKDNLEQDNGVEEIGYIPSAEALQLVEDMESYRTSVEGFKDETEVMKDNLESFKTDGINYFEAFSNLGKQPFDPVEFTLPGLPSGNDKIEVKFDQAFWGMLRNVEILGLWAFFFWRWLNIVLRELEFTGKVAK